MTHPLLHAQNGRHSGRRRERERALEGLMRNTCAKRRCDKSDTLSRARARVSDCPHTHTQAKADESRRGGAKGGQRTEEANDRYSSSQAAKWMTHAKRRRTFDSFGRISGSHCERERVSRPRFFSSSSFYVGIYAASMLIGRPNGSSGLIGVVRVEEE